MSEKHVELICMSDVFWLLSNTYYSFIQGGRKEPVHFDKITSRIQKLCYGLNSEFLDPVSSDYILRLTIISVLLDGLSQDN